jgi:hypothetical protein
VQNRRFVPQLPARRWDDLHAYLLAHRRELASQGTVVEEWRKRGGRSFGPYFRLKFRRAGRQSSLYLGRSPELAEKVRRLLTDIQYPRHSRLVKKRLWAAIRLEKARFVDILAARGLPPDIFGKFPCRVISPRTNKR